MRWAIQETVVCTAALGYRWNVTVAIDIRD